MSDELKRFLEQVHDGVTVFDFDGKETPCIVIEEKKYDRNHVKSCWTIFVD